MVYFLLKKPCLLTWKKKIRGGVLGIATMAGHGSALAVTFSLRDGPHFYVGKSISFGSAVLAVGVAQLFMNYLDKENARKLAEKNSPAACEARDLSVEEIYDAHPDFMYCK